jgi:hypothetical protein
MLREELRISAVGLFELRGSLLQMLFQHSAKQFKIKMISKSLTQINLKINQYVLTENLW